MNLPAHAFDEPDLNIGAPQDAEPPPPFIGDAASIVERWLLQAVQEWEAKPETAGTRRARVLTIAAPGAGCGKTHVIVSAERALRGRVAALPVRFDPVTGPDWGAALKAIAAALARQEGRDPAPTLADEAARSLFARCTAQMIRRGKAPAADPEERLHELTERPLAAFDFADAEEPSVARWFADNHLRMQPHLVRFLAERAQVSAEHARAVVQALQSYAMRPLEGPSAPPAPADLLLELARDADGPAARERVAALLAAASLARPVALVFDDLDAIHGDTAAGTRVAGVIESIRASGSVAAVILSVNEDLWRSAFGEHLPSALRRTLLAEALDLSRLDQTGCSALVRSRLQRAGAEPVAVHRFDGFLSYGRFLAGTDTGYASGGVLLDWARERWMEFRRANDDEAAPDPAALAAPTHDAAIPAPEGAERPLAQQPTAQLDADGSAVPIGGGDLPEEEEGEGEEKIEKSLKPAAGAPTDDGSEVAEAAPDEKPPPPGFGLASDMGAAAASPFSRVSGSAPTMHIPKGRPSESLPTSRRTPRSGALPIGTIIADHAIAHATPEPTPQEAQFTPVAPPEEPFVDVLPPHEPPEPAAAVETAQESLLPTEPAPKAEPRSAPEQAPITPKPMPEATPEMLPEPVQEVAVAAKPAPTAAGPRRLGRSADAWCPWISESPAQGFLTLSEDAPPPPQAYAPVQEPESGGAGGVQITPFAAVRPPEPHAPAAAPVWEEEEEDAASLLEPPSAAEQDAARKRAQDKMRRISEQAQRVQ